MPGDRKTNPHNLTDLQIRFCHEYVKDLNKTRAYIRAGYNVKNENSAAAGASTLLRNPKIQEYLGEIADLSEVKVISEIVSIALSKITDILEYVIIEDNKSDRKIEQGFLRIKPSSEWSDRAKASVKSITVTQTEFGGKVTTTTTVTMYDKLNALEKLMRRLKLYPKDIPVLDAVQLLLSEGVATPEQARVISEGINRMEEELKAINKLEN